MEKNAHFINLKSSKLHYILVILINSRFFINKTIGAYKIILFKEENTLLTHKI